MDDVDFNWKMGDVECWWTTEEIRLQGCTSLQNSTALAGPEDDDNHDNYYWLSFSSCCTGLQNSTVLGGAEGVTSSLPYQPNQQVQTSRIMPNIALVQNIGLVHTSRLGYQVRDKRAQDDWDQLQLQHEHRHHRIAERLVKRSEPSPRFAKKNPEKTIS